MPDTSRQDADLARRRELADFLRSRRDRIPPESVGLPETRRRRAPGLRREEVAQLAGVGVTWYTWLEQARDIKVSEQVLTAVARALRLDADEKDHLFTLAGASPAVADPDDRTVRRESITTIIKQLEPLPAHVVTARNDVVAWNRQDAVLMGDYSVLPKERRNILWLLFTEPAWADLIGGYETEAGIRCVARFRRYFAAHVADPHWVDLRDELLDVSPDFRKAWARHDVSSTSPKVKHFNHPLAGKIRLAATTLWLDDQADARLVVYTALDDDGRRALEIFDSGQRWIPWRSATLDSVPA